MKKIYYALFSLLFVTQLHAATFTLEDNNEVYPESQTVIVSGVGKTESSALKSAFSAAVERVVGTMITSETYIKNGELISENIFTVSPSYILTYKELGHKINDDGLHKVTIEAVVAKRKLAQSLGSITVAVLEIADAEQAHNSLLENAQDYKNAKKILSNVIAQSFADVSSVFDIKIKSIDFFPGKVENGKIPFNITFSISVNHKRYNEKRANLRDALIRYGNATPYDYNGELRNYTSKDSGFTTFDLYGRNREKPYTFTIVYLDKNGTIAWDSLIYDKTAEDMRDFIAHTTISGKMVGDFSATKLQIVIDDKNGEVLFEDFPELADHKRLNRDNNGSNLYLVWDKAADNKYNNSFQLRKNNFGAHLSCGILTRNDSYCYEPEDENEIPEMSASNIQYLTQNVMVSPFIKMAVAPDGSGGFRMDTDTIELSYKGVMNIQDIDKIDKVTVRFLR